MVSSGAASSTCVSGPQRRCLLLACTLQPLLLGVASGEPIELGERWQEWKLCREGADLQDSRRRLLPEPDSSSAPSAARAKFVDIVSEERHKLVSIKRNGELELSSSELGDSVLQLLKRERDPVHVIALFGKVKAGKSTLASALSCAFAHLDGHREEGTPAVHFRPGHTSSVKDKTFGLWASPPFQFQNSEGQTKKYVLLDLEGLGNTEQIREILEDGGKASEKGSAGDMHDPRSQEHALVKLIAMLSEVVSVFVYVSDRQYKSQQDYELIGNALQVTRRNLITTDDSEGTVDFEFTAVNKPRLLVSHRRKAFRDLIKKNSFEANTKYLELEAIGTFGKDCHTGDGGQLTEWGKLLESNFDSIKLNNGIDFVEIPFRLAPVPEMPNDDGAHDYAWHEKPWDYDKDDDQNGGEHCKHYLGMWNDEFRCVLESKTREKSPPRPAAYKLMVDHMAAEIARGAQPRHLARGKEELIVTGELLVEFLEVSVKEMNKIRPLPEAQLWRLILEESCKVQLLWILDVTLGKAFDKEHGKGALLTIEERMVERRRHKPSVSDRFPGWVEATWRLREEAYHKLKRKHFGDRDKEHFRVVRQPCEQSALLRFEEYRQMKTGYIFEAKQLEAEQENHSLKKELIEATWEKNKWIYSVYTLAGTLVLILLSKICGSMSSAVRCVGCCVSLCGGRRRGKEGHAPPLQGGVQFPTGEGGSGVQLIDNDLVASRLEAMEGKLDKLATVHGGGGSGGSGAIDPPGAVASRMVREDPPEPPISPQRRPGLEDGEPRNWGMT